MKDKLVNWGNKAARLQIGIDMNTINISMSRLEDQLEVEKGIVKALEEAKEKENEADTISELLHHTGEFYQADRCYIFLYSKEADSWSNVCEWCENEIQSQQLYLASVPDDRVKLVIGSLEGRQTGYYQRCGYVSGVSTGSVENISASGNTQADASSIVK